MYDRTGQLTPMNNIDEAVEHIENTMTNIAKNFIPNEMKTFDPKDPPWLTRNCKDFYKKYRCKYNVLRVEDLSPLKDLKSINSV